MRRLPWLLVVLLSGCPRGGDTDEAVDADEDGYYVPDDCDDDDPAIHPGARESCDGVDNDCDDEVDEGEAEGAAAWYEDVDEDGFGDPAERVRACSAPAGFVADGTDCDDQVPTTYPGAEETWYDGVDADCAGDDDWDADCDGQQVVDHAGTDCDDTDPTVYLGADETWYDGTDSDCSGGSDYDADGDGHEADPPDGTGGDCDDEAPGTYPGADETWYDGTDSDCSGGSDYDADHDGYDSADHGGTDCDDTDAAVHPNTDELCVDGVDDDCDGTPDDGCPTETHCGPITADETWSSTAFHEVACDVLVEGGSSPTLVVEDGTSVRFAPETGLYVGWSNAGSLVVMGTDAGVVFTSDAATPRVGDWLGVHFGGLDRASEVEGLVVEYAGGNGLGGVVVEYSSPELVGCTIEDNAHAGVHAAHGATPLIQDCSILHNDGPGYHAPEAGLEPDGGVSFSGNEITRNAGAPVVILARYADELDPSSTLSGNDDDAVWLMGDVVDDSGTWRALDVPYRVDGEVYVEGDGRPMLVIEDGAEVEFTADSELFVGWGTTGSLDVEGTDEGVLMTSAESTPEAGEWGGLDFGPHDRGSELYGLMVEYGGGNGLGCLYAQGADLELEDCVVSSCEGHGLHGVGAEVSIEGSMFIDNDDDGVHLDDTSSLGGSFEGNTLTGNGRFALTVPVSDLGVIGSGNLIYDNDEDYIQVLGGAVEDDATWTGQDVPFLIGGDVYIEHPTGPQVTIGDGTSLHMKLGTGMYVGWSDPGGLDIQGTTHKVWMTSPDPSPEAGDWIGLAFGTLALPSSEIDGLILEYAGEDETRGALLVQCEDLPITDSTFRFNDHAGLDLSGGTAAIEGNIIESNDGVGVRVRSDGGLSTIGGPTFLDNLVTANKTYPITLPPEHVGQLDVSSSLSRNLVDAVRITAGTVAGDATWQALDVPYLVTGDVYVEGDGGPELTIEDGVTIEFQEEAGLYVGWSAPGSLEAVGTAGVGITFDSAASVPAVGDWAGIALGPDCVEPRTELRWVTVDFGGDNGKGAVWFYECSGTIGDSTIRYSASWGIYRDLCEPTIDGTMTYASNTLGTVY